MTPNNWSQDQAKDPIINHVVETIQKKIKPLASGSWNKYGFNLKKVIRIRNQLNFKKKGFVQKNLTDQQEV